MANTNDDFRKLTPFIDSPVGVCIRDDKGISQFRNDTCLGFCGKKKTGKCRELCMMAFAPDGSIAPALVEGGVQIFRNTQFPDIEGAFDIVMFYDGTFATSLFYPLSRIYEMRMEQFKDKGLTARELEIVSFMIRGVTNSEITKQLEISKSTLRSHLNRVYKKVDLSESFASGLPARKRVKKSATK
ncbi:helix-turn-helix transcriptional regulator [Bdellovibrionota bacterium FG-2]